MLTLLVLTVALLAGIGVLVVRLGRRQHAQTAGLQALEVAVGRVADTAATTLERLDTFAAAEAEHAERSGRQHRTIDQRVMERHAAAARTVDALAGVVERTAGRVESQQRELGQVRAQAQRLQPQAAARPRPAPDTSAVPGERLLQGLHPDRPVPSVNLVLHAFVASQVFAGVRTAVLAGVEAARQTGRPLRLLVLADAGPHPERATEEPDRLAARLG
ncbi:hypothetical protein GCM10025868_24500 [Angustibacter aerolatus]|uniref:Uncharacterized protein n=1 Tax=Angustibacter aerolatus TaxID=1162965 RepID=A0ABQ6JIY8_9ACTN|nr:hypothetical protein [Angustibacter aerolatus]GMA87200.1 hypothetical protein GCM10025868_24500 [Angustibacter aerolatus]